jgi:hypothetical protein
MIVAFTALVGILILSVGIGIVYSVNTRYAAQPQRIRNRADVSILVFIGRILGVYFCAKGISILVLAILTA